MTNPNLSSNSRTQLRALLWAAPAAAIIAALVNAILFVIAKAAGVFPSSVIIPNANAPMTLQPVIFASMISVILGGFVFSLIGWFTQNSARLFRIVGLVVLGLSFTTPFSIPNAPAKMVLVLELMHIITAIAALWLLPRFVLRRF